MLINKLNPHGTDHHTTFFAMDILWLISETERIIAPDPFEADLILTARALIRAGELKIARFKLNEVITGRLGSH